MGSNDYIDLSENSILNKLSEVHTATLAKVISVNETTINAKPVFKRKVEDKEVEYPVFQDIPVMFLGGGATSTAYPIEAGDYCLLIVCERSFDNWYEGNDDKTPLEDRMFDYSDSFAFVGAKNKAGGIQIPKDGKIHSVGDIVQTGDIIINGVSLWGFIQTHYHNGDSGGVTGTPLMGD